MPNPDQPSDLPVPDWQRKSLPEKLLAYVNHYQKTGYVAFPALEIVARMAAEGIVLVPDKAEESITEITNSAAMIQKSSLQLQSRLDQICNLKVYEPHPLREQIMQLDHRISYLMTIIENQVTPLVPIVNKKWTDEMRAHLRELTSARTLLLKNLEIDIVEARKTDTKKLQSQINYLTQINSISQALAVCSAEVIRGRVPFYHLT